MRGRRDRYVAPSERAATPEGHYDHLNQGWPPPYWNPLKKYLTSAHLRQ